jgi:hypothetical protein
MVHILMRIRLYLLEDDEVPEQPIGNKRRINSPYFQLLSPHHDEEVKVWFVLEDKNGPDAECNPCRWFRETI